MVYSDGTPAEGVTLVDGTLRLWRHFGGTLRYLLDVDAVADGALLGDAGSGADAPASGDAHGDVGGREIVNDGPAGTAGSETGTEGGESTARGDAVEGSAAADTSTVVDNGGKGASQRSVAAAAAAQMQFVSAGSSPSCGIRTDGAVECWGNNDHRKADAPDDACVAVAAGGSGPSGVNLAGRDRAIQLATAGQFCCPPLGRSHWPLTASAPPQRCWWVRWSVTGGM